MNNLSLDKTLESASGVLLIRNGEIIEFFPQTSNGKDLGLSDDEIVLTEAEEMELGKVLQEFLSKTKNLNKKMDNHETQIDVLERESIRTLNRIENKLQKLEAFVK